MHTKLKSQIRLIRWMIRRVRLLEIRKHTCRVSVIEISYTYRCIYKQISDNSIIYKFKIYRYMIVCAITIILIAILLSLFLFRKKKYSIGKKIILIVCFSIGMYILFSIIMLLYFFLGDFSAEELW